MSYKSVTVEARKKALQKEKEKEKYDTFFLHYDYHLKKIA